MGTYTTNLELYKPSIGEQGWGELVNENFDKIDATSITGVIQMYAGSSAPSGWLICNGQAISRITYAALYAVIGTTYGTGDGSTTFNVPNLQGRVPIGVSNTHTLGSTGGEETHTLTIAEMPSHNHSVNPYGKTGNGDYFSSTSILGDRITYTHSTGGDQPHNNMQPYITLSYIIKV